MTLRLDPERGLVCDIADAKGELHEYAVEEIGCFGHSLLYALTGGPKGKRYAVEENLARWYCSCPDFMCRPNVTECKHIRMAKTFPQALADLRAAARRLLGEEATV